MPLAIFPPLAILRLCGSDGYCNARGGFVVRCPRCDAAELAVRLMSGVPIHIARRAARNAFYPLADLGPSGCPECGMRHPADTRHASWCTLDPPASE